MTTNSILLGTVAGCRGFAGNRRSYVKRLPVVEVQETFFLPPRNATLRQWRDEAAKSFVFCVRAWQLITHAATDGTYPRLPKDFKKIDLNDCGLFRPTQAVQQAYEVTVSAARALDAPIIVFETPAEFTPTAAHRDRLTQFFERVDRSGLQFVWDPQGIWEKSDVTAICRDLSLLPGNATDSGSSYVRLGKPRYSEDELVLLAAEAKASNIVYIFNSINMFRDACRLQSLLVCE